MPITHAFIPRGLAVPFVTRQHRKLIDSKACALTYFTVVARRRAYVQKHMLKSINVYWQNRTRSSILCTFPIFQIISRDIQQYMVYISE